jgi:predicted AlkP superfamily phosphohydrolase/phosphomutase
VLRRLDLGSAPEARSSAATRAARATWTSLPRAARRRLGRLPAWLLRRRIERDPSARPEAGDGCGCGIIWADEETIRTRRWFAVPNNDAHGAIRINLAGRERHGVVHRRDMPSIFRVLEEALMEVVNVETGEPIVDAVIPTADLHRRPSDLDDNLPDLIVEWNRSSPVRTAWSPRVGIVHQPFAGHRTGDHYPEGLLVMTAPWVEPGTRVPPVRMVDLAPTLAAMVDVRLEDVDGTPVRALLPCDATTPG